MEIPKHTVEVYSANHVGRREISSEDLLKNVLEKIDLIKGDFRQEEIRAKWKEILQKQAVIFTIDKVEVVVSSGFYVRQFVSDLAKNLNSIATAYTIKRLSVGEYEI